MSKTFLKISFAAIVALVAVSCKKNNMAVDTDIQPPVAVHFAVNKTTDTLVTYFVESTNETYKIKVGLTAPAEQDVTVNFAYSSPDATAGVQYNQPPASITIPAGQTIGTIEIPGLFSGFATAAQVDTLIIKITDASVPLTNFWKGMKVVMRRYCAFDFASLYDGDYDGTVEYTSSGGINWGPYTTTIRDITSTGATTANAVIENLYDYGGEVNAKFEWTNKVHRVTIAEQNTGALVVDAGVTYALWIRTNSTTNTSTFDSCEGTVTVWIDAIAKNPTSGATIGNFSTNYKITMFR